MITSFSITVFLVVLLGLCQGQDGLFPPGPEDEAVGEKVLFTTTITPSSTPLLTVTWTFNGVNNIIRYDSSGNDTGPAYRDRVSLNIYTGTLELRDLTLDDSGNYQLAIITTEVMTRRDQTALNVFERTSRVSINVTPERLIEGQSSANLTCEGTGSIITTEWMKDGQPLSPSNNIIFSVGNRSVSISPVRRSDSGEYQCRLSNPVSSDTATYTMTVNNAKSAGHKDDGGGGGGGVSGIGGVIAGIGGGVIVGFGIGSLIVFLCRKKHASDQTEMTNDQMEMDQLRNYGNDQDQHPVNINDPDPANPDQNEPNEQDIIPYSPVNTNDPDVSNDH